VATLAFGSFAMANNVEFLPVAGVEKEKVIETKSSESLYIMESLNLEINSINYVNVVEEVSDCLNQAYDDYEVFFPEAGGEDNIDTLNWLVTPHCHWIPMFQ